MGKNELKLYMCHTFKVVRKIAHILWNCDLSPFDIGTPYIEYWNIEKYLTYYWNQQTFLKFIKIKNNYWCPQISWYIEKLTDILIHDYMEGLKYFNISNPPLGSPIDRKIESKEAMFLP